VRIIASVEGYNYSLQLKSYFSVELTTMAAEESMNARWTRAMHKFIGVQPTSKTWLIWLIFGIKMFFSPVQLIVGSLLFHHVTADPSIPVVMIIVGLVETVWTPLFFFIYIYLPIKVLTGQKPVSNKTTIRILTFILGLLSLGLIVLVVILTVQLVQVISVVGVHCEPSDTECVSCPDAVFYGCWVFLGFKYLDLLKLVPSVGLAFLK